ncbi:efflux RND transporter periplasmic adaptor subunit [sulfur-oxidizing endosymbiont of Gigantopelta aegis]|uniref:efflux RND transporter periplasmic adaptor subunit n=1 Tax=sulfur-oxidizing endosymbiont of Gigantopelta aegis TaxID=2794934 RepID=UPI0018DBE847|nr:efflux RND transporter periplasmic adaptor subunit [sulfur-oxidizing endosymbiont of Gigantopelta aegis]
MIIRPLAFFTLLFALLMLQACTEQEEPEVLIRPVITEQVEIKPNWQQSTYAGEIRARYKMALGFRIGGKIVERYIEVGDIVKPGTLLAKLDPDDSKLQLMRAGGALEAAKAERRKAQLDLKRYTQLYKSKMISAAEHLRFSNDLDIANARYTQAEAQLEVTRNQSDYTDLYTDKGGVITSLEMEVGQVIVPGQTVVNLALPDDKEVVIAVAESRLDEVRLADIVKISLWIDPKRFYQGRIREISPGADPVTRTYTVKISLLDAGDRAQLGMTTTVIILQKKNEMVAQLPLSALFQKDGKAAVWIFSPDSAQVHLQTVDVLEYQYDSLLIQSGLKNGQTVVVAGVHQLYEGQTVRLYDATQW